MKKFFTIIALVLISFTAFSQDSKLVPITTDCKITKHIIGLVNPDVDVDFGPTLAFLDWKVQIEWVRLGDGGICKLWLINDEGDRTLLDRWSSTENLNLVKMTIYGDEPSTSYVLTDDVFTFFQIIIDESENAFCFIETREL